MRAIELPGPHIIGVCGASAAGKSVFSQDLRKQLGSDQCAIVQMDRYYCDLQREGVVASTINYDEPAAFDLEQLRQDLLNFKLGKTVLLPNYDFYTHTRTSKKTPLVPVKFLIVEGLFLFNQSFLADLFSLKIYIETPSEVCLVRRINRDSTERGRTIRSICEQYLQTVAPMYKRHIRPNKELADLLINGEADFEPEVQVLAQTII